MKGEVAVKLHEVCLELTDTEDEADELYNILEGYALQYLDEKEE